MISERWHIASPIQFSIITVIKYYLTVHVVFMQKEPYNNTYCHTVNVVIHRNSFHTQDTNNHTPESMSYFPHRNSLHTDGHRHRRHRGLNFSSILMRNMLNADYGCRVHSTSSASRDMMLLDASRHMVASTVSVTIMHSSNVWSLILLTAGGITILLSDVHPQNALSSISSSPLQSARCTCINHVQSWNAHSLIALTECLTLTQVTSSRIKKHSCLV